MKRFFPIWTIGSLLLSQALLSAGPTVAFLIGEQEYDTRTTLPAFAEAHLRPEGITPLYVHVSDQDPNDFPAIDSIKNADVLVISQNQSVHGFTNITTTSLYAQTLMDYIWRLKAQNGIFHVVSSNSLTKYEFGLAVAQEFGLDSGLIKPFASTDAKDISLSTSKLAQSLSTSIETQAQGIALAKEQQLWQRSIPT